jgi:SAM-dependent methyltransferase
MRSIAGSDSGVTLESVTCDFCGSADAVPVAHQTDKLHRTTDEVFAIVRCAACGLHYTNPRPSAAEIGRYYADDYAFHTAPSGLRRAAGRVATTVANARFAGVVDVIPGIGRRLARYVKPDIADPVRAYYAAGGQGTFLDIGCGAGANAHFWGNAGGLLAYRRLVDVAGVEVADRAREPLHAAGIEAWANLDAVPRERRFGMIRMNWSLEHVHSPSRFFAFLRDRLAPDGRAMISVPNYDGLIYRLARDCVELPIHLYHFRPLDLHNYATRHGLRIVDFHTFSYPQMFVVAGEAGLLPQSFAREPGLRAARAFQTALEPFDSANWGNDMIAVLARAE